MRHTRRRRKRRRLITPPAKPYEEDYASLVRRHSSGLPFVLHGEASIGHDTEPETAAPTAKPGSPGSGSAIDPTTHELLVNAAAGAARRGEFDRAIAIYAEFLRGHPDHLEVRHALGLLLEQAGRPEEAVDHYDHCLSLAPEDPRFLTARGAVCCTLRRFADAESALLRALHHDPSNVDTHFHFGVLKSRKGLWSEALPYLRRSIELDPGCAAAYLHLGDVLNHLDDLPGALQAYQRSAELGPSNARALYGLGVVYDRLNLPEEAAVMYRRSRELAGT